MAPGIVASSGMDRYPPSHTEAIRAAPGRVPLRRFGTESEIAAAIVFLLSPAAAFVSGACLRVDGAAPNARRSWGQVGTGVSTPPFNGFQPRQPAEDPAGRRRAFDGRALTSRAGVSRAGARSSRTPRPSRRRSSVRKVTPSA